MVRQMPAKAKVSGVAAEARVTMDRITYLLRRLKLTCFPHRSSSMNWVKRFDLHQTKHLSIGAVARVTQYSRLRRDRRNHSFHKHLLCPLVKKGRPTAIKNAG